MKGVGRFGKKGNQFELKLLEKLKRIGRHIFESGEVPNGGTNPFLVIDIQLAFYVYILMLGV